MKKLISTKLQSSHVDISRIASTGAALGFGAVTQFVLTLVVSKKYGPEQAGFFFLSLTILTIVSMFARAGFDNSLVRLAAPLIKRVELAKVAYVRNMTSAIGLAASLVAGMLLYWWAEFLANSVFNSSELLSYFRLVALAIPLFSLMLLNAEFLKAARHIELSISTRHIVLYLAAISGIMLAEGNSTLAAFKWFLLGIIIGLAFSELAIQSKTGLNYFSRRERFITTKRLLRMSAPLLAASASFALMGWTDTILIGIFESESQVGIYNAALRVSLLLSLLLTALNNFLSPQISVLYHEREINKLRGLFVTATGWMIAFLLPAYFFIVFFNEEILSLFGDGFVPGATVLVILATAQFVNVASGPVGYMLCMTAYEDLFGKVIVSMAGLNLILNLLLIPVWGIEGAALATAISISVNNLTLSFYSHRKLSISTMNLFRRRTSTFEET